MDTLEYCMQLTCDAMMNSVFEAPCRVVGRCNICQTFRPTLMCSGTDRKFCQITHVVVLGLSSAFSFSPCLRQFSCILPSPPMAKCVVSLHPKGLYLFSRRELGSCRKIEAVVLCHSRCKKQSNVNDRTCTNGAL